MTLSEPVIMYYDPGFDGKTLTPSEALTPATEMIAAVMLLGQLTAAQQ